MQTVSGFGFNWNEEMDFDKCGGGNKRGGWKTKMDFDKRGGWKIFMKSINVEGGFFCGGWIFSKSLVLFVIPIT